MSSPKKEILVLGGGFAGVYTARCLEKILRPEEASIHIVNVENYWVNQPLLAEVISGSVGITDVVSPIRRLCRRTHLVMRSVESIDLRSKTVIVSPGFRPRRLELHYDYLVIALGGRTDFSRMPGMVEHALPFRTLGDALEVRNRLIHTLEEADVETDPDMRAKLLTFVVAGGGFSGVEVLAEINDFVRRVKRNYLRLRDEPVRAVLIHSGARILPEVDERLAFTAQKILVRRGVDLRLKDRLVAATSEKAILKSGAEIPTKTIVSAVPSAAPPVLQKLDCAKDKDRLQVNGNLELVGYEGQVWALGDCAAIKTQSGNAVPATAQHATREARVAAKNIAATIRGAKPSLFSFEGLGKMGSLGHYSAVADILGVRISGFFAWFVRRTIYLMKMPGFNRKVRIACDWAIALIFPPDLVQVRLLRGSAISRQHFEPGEIVFNQGDLGNCVYVIEKGECDVLLEKDGETVRLAALKGGDYFGEMAVLNDVSRSATIRTRAAMDVLVIPKSDFDMLKTAVPAFGNVFRELARTRTAAGTARTAREENSR